MSLFAELKRRNVLRVLLAYVVFSWLAMQVADVLQSALDLPTLWSKGLLALLAIGLVPVVVFAWVFEMTPEGLKRESEVPRDASITAHTARRLDYVVIVLLGVAIAFFAYDRFTRTPAPVVTEAPATAEPAASDEHGVPVVAVLPLKALSTEEEGTFLASGLHDDLLTRLAKLHAFKVISRTSVMEYADTRKNIRQIGQELGAHYILEGGLQAIGGRVSINAQLIDATTDEHLWAEIYNRELTTANLFEVQGEIAGAIAGAMKATLSPDDVAVLQDVPTQNLEAYRAYLRGLETANTLTPSAMLNSVEAFSEAVAADPNFADAWAALAKAYLRRYWEEGAEVGATPDPSLRESAEKALDRATALGPNRVETLLARAYYQYYAFRNYEAALDEQAKALAIAPNNNMVIALRGFLLRRLGRVDEAADVLLQALEYNRNGLGHRRELMSTLMDAGRCAEGMQQADEAVNRFPDAGDVLSVVAALRLVCGDAQAAWALLRRSSVTTPAELIAAVNINLHSNRPEAAIEVLRTEGPQFQGDSLMRLTTANFLAALYRLTGQPDAAATALQDAEAASGEVADSPAAKLQLAYLAGLRGDRKQLVTSGRQALDHFPNDAYVLPSLEYELMWHFALAGADQAAWELFAKWAPHSLYTELSLLPGNPFLDRLRADPRFQEVYASALARYPEQNSP